MRTFSEPRYTSLPNIMKAKKKPIEKVSAEDLGVDLKPRLETVKVTEPAKRKGGVKVCEFGRCEKFGRAHRATNRWNRWTSW